MLAPKGTGGFPTALRLAAEILALCSIEFFGRDWRALSLRVPSL
jgi:hypothetical protein